MTTPRPAPRSSVPRPVVPTRDPAHPFTAGPFTKLARTHAFGLAGDAIFAIALAGSVFFSLDFNAARWNVALYLVLTIAPFAVAAPLIGPLIDRIRGGRKWVIVGGMALRALLCVFVIRHIDSLLFYPEAFLMLVLGKTYTISKSAIVPTTVETDQELVEANSKLAVISALAVVAAAPPAGLLLKLGGPSWALGLALVVFTVATAFALQLPQVAVAVEPADEAERQELRSAGILLAGSAMGLVRGIVGFVAFMLAFDFKNNDAPLWHLGFVAATAQLGFFVGSVVVPRVRRYLTEERIIITTLVVMAVGGVLTALIGGLVGAAMLSFIVGAASSMAKQAFDAIVQRDAPDANRGRSFARFETRFQLLWVIGALIPIIVPIPAPAGSVMLAAVAVFAVVSYVVGASRIRTTEPVPGETPETVGASNDPPPPEPIDPSARRWASPGAGTAPPRPADWTPPPGFVSSPLGDPPTQVEGEPSDGAYEQVPLPLDLDATVPDRVHDTEMYPEPPWRDSVPRESGAADEKPRSDDT